MFMAGISGIIPGVNSVAVGAPGGTDPYWLNVVLMAGCNGASSSTTVPDESPAAHGNGTITGANNDAVLNTSIKKFGSAALRLDGSQDQVSWADHNDWSFSNGAFTVEGWFYFDTATLEASSPLVSHWEATGNQREWILAYNGDLGTNALRLVVSSAGSASDLVVAYNWTPTADTWYHIAVDRSGNVFRLYVNGVMQATATNSITMFGSNSLLRLGGAGTDFFKGSMDEVRITKGVARYASDGGFSVPTAAYPRS